jgi:uncharacterized LabA/DUF88 family protein
MINTELSENHRSITDSIYVFIDASNLWEAQKAKGYFLDYQKLIDYIKVEFNKRIVKIFYYTAYPANGTRGYSLEGKHKFFVFLKKGLGFEVIKKELKRISIIDEYGELIIKEKGNMDVEITVEAISRKQEYTEAIFFTGDSDFLALVTYLKKGLKKIYIFSSKNNISEELRTGGDGYTDILDIANDIWGRKLQRRPELEQKDYKENENHPHC